MTDLMTSNDWRRRELDADLSLRGAAEMHHDHCTVDVLGEVDGWSDEGYSAGGVLHPLDLERFILYAELEGWDIVQLITSAAVFEGRPLALLRKKPSHRRRGDDGKLLGA